MPEDAQGGGRLTDEQVRILELVTQGWSDRRIALEMRMSLSTLRRRLRAASDALGAPSRLTLAVAAVRAGIVPDGGQNQVEHNLSGRGRGVGASTSNDPDPELERLPTRPRGPRAGGAAKR